ncbi:hypothetical protein HBZC1_00180 [Helicobacter bizzozeronii CIII-1]|uniref:Uncharacterized protein n=1 Tax=Helicobacter bizzozeronii (strain CIII-1) TaxID=1002804 RepID=F8KQK0_HELBC|nr:hypothetical protein HBZC1_00180 [Helicobacter bizzozeronii CIII-1]
MKIYHADRDTGCGGTFCHNINAIYAYLKFQDSSGLGFKDGGV